MLITTVCSDLRGDLASRTSIRSKYLVLAASV